jgi:hypothetical protein
MDHPGVLGCILTNNGRSVFTNMDNNKTFIIANRLNDFQEIAYHCVRSIDPEDELTVIRIKTSKYEILNVIPTSTHGIIAIQNTTSFETESNKSLMI